MGQEKILIVDDDLTSLKLLEARLSSAGYSVIKADNGQEALELAKTQRPGLILLDIMMPGMDGGTVGEILKEDPATKGIPFIFLSSLYTKQDEERQGRTVSGNVIIAKPCDPAELLEEVRKQLGGKA